jgi:ABC-type multidrug transport system fused ATPase/permease subunit
VATTFAIVDIAIHLAGGTALLSACVVAFFNQYKWKVNDFRLLSLVLGLALVGVFDIALSVILSDISDQVLIVQLYDLQIERILRLGFGVAVLLLGLIFLTNPTWIIGVLRRNTQLKSDINHYLRNQLQIVLADLDLLEDELKQKTVYVDQAKDACRTLIEYLKEITAEKKEEQYQRQSC